MGRFQSTVEFYSRYREPYSPRFFSEIAQQLPLHGTESLLDIGCGPGLLALGFSPYVAHCTGLDPEPGMIAAAREAASAAHIPLSFIQSTLEDAPLTQCFDLLTIGRALHWLNRQTALPRLEQLAAPNSRLLVCTASSGESDSSLWVRTYNQVRHAYASDPNESRYRIDSRAWFADSCFHHFTDIAVTEVQSITTDDLIGRALSRSNTSPDVLGERRRSFEAEIREALQPFADHGILQEQIVSRASVFEAKARR